MRTVLEDIGREVRRSGLLVTTMPNSEYVVLDIPRRDRKTIDLERGLKKIGQITSPEQMPIPIGVTPEGIDIIRNLEKMPHLLIGGTTGSGKTMLLYGILCALLRTHPKPDSLRLLLSTSGIEDFVFCEGLPHLEAGKVIDSAREAVELLQTHVNEVGEERASVLAAARCRDIFEYNEKHEEEKIPPLVVMIDEFADLVAQFGTNRTVREDFYSNVLRIAQIGRKRGIHLILCTQRPSADLVPTNIRNLMNGRVALHVNDSIASKMILDEAGAEQLQMRGDLLFKENSEITRAQAYFVSTDYFEELLNPLKR